MTEKDMEDLIAAYPDDFFPQKQFALVGRQRSLGGVGRFDLSFEDRFKSTILMELKARTLKYEDATQVANYRDELKRNGCKNVVMWLVAPQIPHSVREFLDDKGIEYTEIHVAEFRRVAERHDFAIKSDEEHAQVRIAAVPARRMPRAVPRSGDGSPSGIGIREAAERLSAEWTVRDLAEAFRVHKSNAHRRLKEWSALGKVEKISVGRRGRRGSLARYRFVAAKP